jgi:hypothetical protein
LSLLRDGSMCDVAEPDDERRRLRAEMLLEQVSAAGFTVEALNSSNKAESLSEQ